MNEITELEEYGFIKHSWVDKDFGLVDVYQIEEFKFKWAMTKLVCFVFIVKKNIKGLKFEDLVCHYNKYLKFAKKNKISKVPQGLQLSYAILPFYVNSEFPSVLKEQIKTNVEKKWSSQFFPSLYESATKIGTCNQFNTKWGKVYHPFIKEVINKTFMQI